MACFNMMDYVRKFDIELEKEHYYAGEKLKGWVIIDNSENLKVRGRCWCTIESDFTDHLFGNRSDPVRPRG